MHGRDSPLTSDDSVYQSRLFRPPEPAASNKSNTPDGMFKLATAVIESVIPADFNELPLEELLRLRTESFEDRRRFQDRMAEFGKEIASANSEKELRETIDQLGRRCATLFALSVPSWPTAT